MMRSIKSRGGLTRARGFTDSVRLMWVHSAHVCGEVHNAMTILTGLQHQTSEQHIKLGRSRIKRDNSDSIKVQNWFNHLIKVSQILKVYLQELLPPLKVL